MIFTLMLCSPAVILLELVAGCSCLASGDRMNANLVGTMAGVGPCCDSLPSISRDRYWTSVGKSNNWLVVLGKKTQLPYSSQSHIVAGSSCQKSQRYLRQCYHSKSTYRIGTGNRRWSDTLRLYV